MTNAKILIIDDDKELNRLLTSYLGQFQLSVFTATLPSEGLSLLEKEKPDLIVLDVMLPEMNGLELCKEIRNRSKIPIMMLTARGDLSDRVVGLEMGADDYLPKPYEPRELVARIQSILRRTRWAQFTPPKQQLISEDLVLDLAKASAFLAGTDLDLTAAEFSILKHLMENPGRTLSRDEITQQVRGGSRDSMDRTIDMIVSRLRNKLKDQTKNPRFLKTMWGEGYRFVGDVQER